MSVSQSLIQFLNCSSQMRYRDRAAHHERDVKGVHELFARDSAIRALLDMIRNAVVAAQNNRGRESHQLLRLLIERALFVSLRVEREKSFDAEVAAAEQLLVHFGTIVIELVHQTILSSPARFRFTAIYHTRSRK